MEHKWGVNLPLASLTMRLLAHSVHKLWVDRLHWHGWGLKGVWRSKGNVVALLTLLLMFTQ